MASQNTGTSIRQWRLFAYYYEIQKLLNVKVFSFRAWYSVATAEATQISLLGWYFIKFSMFKVVSI